MHASSGHTLAELLRDLSAKLAQGANSISHAPSLPKIKSIECDIHASLAILRRHINPLESPLYRLPTELFPEVASHFASETDLVNATHVSYHLRTALLSHPSLWSHLNFEHEMMARSFFERSKQMPLHVDMARDTTRTVNSLAELRQQSDRIVTLKLRRWLIQKMFLSESLPSLRRLEVFLDYDDDDSDEEWDTTWTSVWGPTEKATSWSFPSLTTLVVYVLNPIPFYTPNLTCFKFWDQEDYTDVNKLVRFLENCPLLQHINISCVQEPESEHDLVVSLPNLRTYTQTASGERDFLEVLNIADENEVTGTLELINAEGTKVCFERAVFWEEEYWLLAQGNAHDVTHLDFLRSLDRLSVETLCIDGYLLRGGGKAAVEFFKEVLGFGSVRTLILSRSAARVCLIALDQDPGAGNHSPWFLPIDTIIIYTDSAILGLSYEVFQPLLRVAQKREVAGFPFKSVSLFRSERSSAWLYDQDLDELKRCVGKLEVVIGEDALDWNVDEYFLDGLEHLQQNRDVQWD